MRLSEIVGQERAVGLLRRALASGRLSHAYVFSGPAGVGKRATALALARAASCTVAPGDGCEQCVSCRPIDLGVHPDVFVEDLATAQRERSASRETAAVTRVSIEQVRRLTQHLGLRPLRARRKIGIVDDAEKLTLEGQNALLKTLEEPSGQATLILVTVNADALLPTIRSRCQRLGFAPLAEPVIAALLERDGVAQQAAIAAAALAEGSLERARLFASSEGSELREQIVELLGALPRMPMPRLLEAARSLADARSDERRKIVFATLLGWYRSRLDRVLDDGAAGAGGADRASGADPVAREAAVRSALRQIERVCATELELATNANAHLAWDKLLLELKDAS